MKSRTSSAFLAFVQNLLFALLCGGGFLIFEISLFNLWPVFSLEISHWQLWVIPAAVSGFIFLFRSFHSRLARFMICAFCIMGILITGVMYGKEIADLSSAYILDLRISEQKNEQLEQPEYPEAFRLSEDPLLVYWVDDPQTEEGLDEQQLENIVTFIRNLPPVLTQYAASVYLVEDQIFKNQNPELEKSGEVFGVSSTAEASADIRVVFEDSSVLYTYLKDGTTVFLNDPVFYRETIVHELTHLLDYYSTGVQELKRSSPEFTQFYEKAPDAFGSYGATAPEEYFAEAGVCYFLYPQMMKETSPEVYSFFERNYPYQPAADQT